MPDEINLVSTRPFYKRNESLGRAGDAASGVPICFRWANAPFVHIPMIFGWRRRRASRLHRGS
ncbi:hypothetical protein HMP0721_2175 [Pseudoramibacter alactolyticus ATCC 23263]|uniref:Uncharacterized protein n=1 Tax=Pseudoramibacter alactolyticus ATCC 23263 TaxID=887929 RepID=E6MJJ0_9FIRM|nr:hypothetical protein HMP0721_2175 [Pseudoramibacter alactolyticus ATCC 23263]